MKIYIGTSGWVYKSWHELLYPADLKKDFLAYYSRHFGSVEINTSFYHLPRFTTFEKWYKETPNDFRFSVKISRYITHRRMLKGGVMPLKRFFRAARGLKEKLSVVLIQLPPRLTYSQKSFKRFIADLKKVTVQLQIKSRYAIEPRHYTWMSRENIGEIRQIAKENGIGLVFANSSVFPNYSPEMDNITSDFVYVRFHGPEEFAASQYGTRLLRPWAGLIDSWKKKGLTIYSYFNDDAHGFAVKDAKILMKLTGTAIGLSKARKEGAKVPARKKKGSKSSGK